MNEAADIPPITRVECPPARDPAVRLFIFAGMLLAFGIWCFIDAFVRGKYPLPAEAFTWKKINLFFAPYFNHIGGIVLPLGGLVPLAMAVRFLTRKLVADEAGIGYAGATQTPWHAVTRLDAGDLRDKGILRLETAAAKPVVLDSWKLENFKALVAFVEQHVPPGAIDAAQTPTPPAPADDQGDQAGK